MLVRRCGLLSTRAVLPLVTRRLIVRPTLVRVLAVLVGRRCVLTTLWRIVLPTLRGVGLPALLRVVLPTLRRVGLAALRRVLPMPTLGGIV
ncbi:hypothetical protein WU83_21370, partial [Mycobacterium nebraskense]